MRISVVPQLSPYNYKLPELYILYFLRDYKPDVIFHFGAVPRVTYSIENPYETAQANVQGTVNLLEKIVKADLAKTTRFVMSSSSSVYGGADTLPTPEYTRCNPKSPYALEKFHCDLGRTPCLG